MKISVQIIPTLFFSFIAIFIYCNILFKRNPVMRIGRLRKIVFNALIINVIFFMSVALYFNYTYGYIADDVNYFNGALNFSGGFFNIRTGNEFMFYISRPLRLLLDLDRPSFHVIFGAMGFLGSLNFFFILSKTTDLLNKKKWNNISIKFYSIFCFPNFMVWGRFYGKDSIALFLGSIYCIGVYNLIIGTKRPWRNILLAGIPIFLLYKVRPHIAMVFTISFIIGIYFKSINRKNLKTLNMEIFYKVLFPIILAIALSIGAVNSLKFLTKSETISIDNVQSSLVNATVMGASGGSATELSGRLIKNPNIVFTPRQVAINLGMILFAPMPWQIRGVADALALLSNILLLLLIIRFVKQIDMSNVFQKYLFVVCGLLCLLLSFMTGNVGLILRQKTIILPFLFLLLFSNTNIHENITFTDRNNLPKSRFNS
jgi:hypothetical protein